MVVHVTEIHVPAEYVVSLISYSVPLWITLFIVLAIYEEYMK